MKTLFRHRPSPAMVVACIALLVALDRDERRGRERVGAELRGNSPAPRECGDDREDQEPQRDRRQDRVERSHRADRPQRDADPERLRAELDSRRPRWPVPGPAGVDRCDHRSAGDRRRPAAGGTSQNGAYDTESVAVNCNANEKAISAGTGWSDDAIDRELWTQRITPIVTNNVVTGFRATGGNDSGNASTFTLYVLCYVG